MKFTPSFVSASAGLAAMLPAVLAAPTPTESDVVARAEVVKRASITDACDIGYASGTTGGAGGTTTTVSTYAQFTEAAALTGASVIVVSAPITEAANQVKLTSDTTVVGTDSSVVLTGFGLLVKKMSNVIIRNIGIKEVLAANGDAIGVQYSTQVWIDHVDVSSNRDHDKDYYDGLIDVTHASDMVTISNSYIHDHWKASLVGHSDSNGDEDTGYLHLTYDSNYWQNINSRGPSFRFGTGHVINSYYLDCGDGINTRDGAQMLVESNVFSGLSKPLYSTDSGYAVENDNDFGAGANAALAGTLTSISDYKYTLLGSANVVSSVTSSAGQTLSF
ncbi:putative pectate lyase a protein [Coleophoma crateriformis]|uniref:pectate lyase n=1 Tax=Coleophoma crateriformis TaxID=565419 RepID=A0A3D8RNN0_9HELO|nr:putative pectate lyase a protein [Coleophoma crateriformis]